MSETLHSPKERKAQYRNILHYFVGEAREEATRRTDVPPRVLLVNMLADALYETEQFPSRSRNMIKKDPTSDAALAYTGLLAAHGRGDFKRFRCPTEPSETLRQNPDYIEAQRQVNLTIRGDGDHLVARLRSYHISEYILFVLPHEERPETPTEAPQVPRQPVGYETKPSVSAVA